MNGTFTTLALRFKQPMKAGVGIDVFPEGVGGVILAKRMNAEKASVPNQRWGRLV